MNKKDKNSGIFQNILGSLGKDEIKGAIGGLRKDTVDAVKKEVLNTFTEEILASLKEGSLARLANGIVYVSTGEISPILEENPLKVKQELLSVLQEIDSLLDNGEFETARALVKNYLNS